VKRLNVTGKLIFKSRQKFILFILFTFCVVVSLSSLASGSFNLPLFELFFGAASEIEREVFFEIRMPRVLLAAIVGFSLGITGASLQGLFRNPLADPGLIGVSAGAAFGAVAAIVIFSNLALGVNFGTYLVPFAAIIGSMFVIILVYLLTGRFSQIDVAYMLLVGIALNALATVGIGLFTFISTDSELRGLTFWMMGSFGAARWDLVLPSMIVLLSAAFWMVSYSRRLDIIQLGEIEAGRLGVDTKKIKIAVILSSSILVGLSVALAGIVGFIGLVVPHLVRILGGPHHRFLLPASALMGAALTVTADLVSRIIIQPAELPVGLVTSALGAPFFLWLIIRFNSH